MPPKEINEPDEVLVGRARKGGRTGRKAFQALVYKHQQKLVRYLLYLLGSMDDASDVAQETFARAYLALEQLKEDTSFAAWLRSIGTRLAFNHRRAGKTRKRYEDKSAPKTEQSGTAAQAAEREAILLVLDQLSYAYREILVMYYVEEAALKEIASALDIGESAAKMRLSRARAEFKSVYEKVTRYGSGPQRPAG